MSTREPREAGASTLELWVSVEDRGDVEAVRRAGIAPTLVVRAGGSPLYGRPGEPVCLRFAASPPPGVARRTVAAMPLRAGVLVPGDAAGLALLEALRAQGRAPLAVAATTADDARRAAASGASAVVVPGAEAIEAIGATHGIRVIAEVGDAAAAEAAVRRGAAGLLVPASLAIALVGRSVVADRLPKRAGTRATAGPARAPRPASATIGAVLDRAVRRHGAADALVDVAGRGRWSYEQLWVDVRRIGRALVAAGVEPGDRVALWARAVPEWPLVQLAAGSIGAILVTANPSAPDEELREVLLRSRSSLLLGASHSTAGRELLARLAADRGGELRAVVGLPCDEGEPDGPGLVGWDAFLAAGERVTDTELDARISRTRPDDVASILFTSGTTGAPKGAMLTHRGMLQNATAVGGNLHLGRSDRLCLAVPFHHCFGSVMGTLATVSYGSALVLPARWFDADATLRAVEAERCTVLYGVPTMFIAELEAQSRRPADLSSLRTGIISGAPVAVELAEHVAHELHLPELVVAYGLTEASPVVTQTRIADPPPARLGTVGRAIGGAEVRAVDPATGRPVSAGTMGELCTRGPMVMRGFFEDPDATAAMIDGDGWLHTGDLASRDERGNWQIVGRLKDLIIRGGENISPAEIEAVARRHPDVVDSHVVGVPSEYFGEDVMAFVRARPGSGLDEAGVRAFLAAHLAPYKVPREVRFVDSFPMTGSGKVQKHRLRELAEQALPAMPGGTAGPSPTPDTMGPDPTTGSRSSTDVAPTLPLLAPKVLPGRAAADVLSAASSSTTPFSPAGRQPSRPPRTGWTRPRSASWAWQPTDPSRNDEPTDRQEDPVTADIRRRGQRIKTWGIGDNVEAQIEATGEAPIMYKALGTPVRTSHPFNLYGDIRSQPDALRGTFESGAEIEQVARRLAERDISGIIGLGSGTSQFVAQVANAAFSRYAGIPAWDYDSLAFLKNTPPFDWQRTVAVGYSGSGSTVDTVAATRQCHDAGAFTLAFTSIEGSPVVQASDARILTAGGFDTGGSDTFHYTTRIAAAIYLAIELGRIRQPRAFDYDRLRAQLVATADQMEAMFDAVDARCQTIADAFLGMRSILAVGDGPNYGTAEEIALKFDEMAHIPTKAMNPGRHIHGALGLTDEDILTILVAPPGISYDDLERIAKVTQILKTPSVAIVSDSDRRIAEIVDYVIRLPVEDETIFPVLAVLPGQLIPYWCGVKLGLNPDTQRSNVPKHARAWHMLFPPGTH